MNCDLYWRWRYKKIHKWWQFWYRRDWVVYPLIQPTFQLRGFTKNKARLFIKHECMRVLWMPTRYQNISQFQPKIHKEVVSCVTSVKPSPVHVDTSLHSPTTAAESSPQPW